MCVKIDGELHYPWRAVNEDGEIQESYFTTTRPKLSLNHNLKSVPLGLTGNSCKMLMEYSKGFSPCDPRQVVAQLTHDTTFSFDFGCAPSIGAVSESRLS